MGLRISNHALVIAEKRGAIILTAHYGNFELLPLAHSIYGHRLAMIHRPQPQSLDRSGNPPRPNQLWC